VWHVEDSFESKMGLQPLVFIHGRFSSLANWKPHAEYFRKKGHRVILYDLDGHDKSSGDGRLTLSQHAEGLRHVLDHLGVQKAVVIGHSDGGVIAQQFAANHPERVLGLALVNSYVRLPEDTRLMISRLSELYDEEQRIKGLRRKWELAKIKLQTARLLTEGNPGWLLLKSLFLGKGKKALDVLQNHSLAFNDVRAPFLKSPPPMCIMHTSRDFLVTQKPIEDFMNLYDVNVHVLDLNTHFPHDRRPAWVRRHLQEFLQTQAPSG